MKSRSLSKSAFVIALLLALPATAQVTFYGQEGLRGRSFTTNRPVSNLGGTGFNDRAASAIVQRGQWEVCEDANYGGNCMVLRRGQYPSLASLGMNKRISSVRPVNRVPGDMYAPPPPVAAPYPYYPHYGEHLYQARITSVRAVYGPPEQRCWVERNQVVGSAGPNIPGAIIGGVLGGVLGHQIGNGRGNDFATAIGAIGGAALGANVGRSDSRAYSQDVRRCAAAPGPQPPAYWDVTYVFHRREHRAQLDSPPGSTITVNGRGEPRL